MRDTNLDELVRLAGVGLPQSSSGPGATFLRGVAAAFAWQQPLSQARVAERERLAAAQVEDWAETVALVTAARELSVLEARSSVEDEYRDLLEEHVAVRQATEGLYQAALRLLTALFAESQRGMREATADLVGNHAERERPLSREEDARLRSLNAMRTFGTLSADHEALWETLRHRDQRATVREPNEVTVVPVTEAD